MDSSGVYFIDPMFGPGHQAAISRKNAQGLRMVFQVPLFILRYNEKMHSVDVVDQIRKAFAVDLSHATRKYTVRMMEILFSMILAQGYNLHRTVHKDYPDILKSAHKYKLSLLTGLLRHPIVTIPPVAVLPAH